MRAKTRTLHCEFLEDRRVLATFSVNDLGDTSDANPGDGVAEDAAGNTTFRAAIEEANALAGADDIDFNLGGTINLTLGALEISDDLTIDGGDNSLTVDATAAGTRVVTIDDGTSADVTVAWQRGLAGQFVLTGGSAAQGGGIFNAENTTLRGVTVQGNTANAPDSTTAAFGGGVFNSGTMLITDQSVISGNQSLDSATPDYFNALGGGIANYGIDADLIISNSTVSENYTQHYGGGIMSLHGTVTINNGSVITQNSTTNNGLFTSGAGIGLLSVFYSVDNGAMPATITPTNGVGGFSLTMEDSALSENVLTGGTFPYGAGIYGSGYGSIVVNDSTITGNRVEGGGGARGAAGFFYGNDGSALASGIGAPGLMTIEITGTMIDGNTAAEESGGFGFRANQTNPIEMTIRDSTIRNNVAMTSDGAAGLLHVPDGFFDNASLTIENTTISGNSSYGYAGAIYAEQTNVTITDSTIDNNTAVMQGGGLLVRGTGIGTSNYSAPATQIIRSTISNNVSGSRGGGVFAAYTNLLLDNSTISGNSADAGGGVFIYGNNYGDDFHDTLLDLQNATVTNNSANTGGGLYAYYASRSALHNSIISGNSAAAAPDVYEYVGGSEYNTYYSLIGDGTGSGFVDGTNGSLVGDALNPVDAMLGALADNGGDTLTHLPMAGSPAINAGDPAAMGGTDQTGNPRVNEDRIDMGSVETGGDVGPLGDFNDDGLWDCLDINALTAETAAGTNNPAFDMNDDGLVNGADITDWLAVAGGINLASMNAYARGDANLDGIVDGLDFIVWNTNKFSTNTDWCGGNFNGDSVTDGLDFIEWNTNKFTQQGPITSGSGPSSTIELLGNALGRRERLVKGGRDAPSGPIARNPSLTPKIASTADSDSRVTVARLAATSGQPSVTTRPVPIRAVHEFQQLSDSVSHTQRQVQAAVDRIFAGL